MTAVLAQAAAAPTSGAAEFWVFWILAPLALGAGVSMVLLKNPVHAALMLVLNFGAIAVFYAVLEAQFLSTIQVIVYAGAIMVLFLFVLMLLGVDRNPEPGSGGLRGQRPAALILGLVLFGALLVSVAGPWMGRDSACNASPEVQAAVQEAGADAAPCAGLTAVNAVEGGNPRQIGLSLFTTYVWPFEVTSVLLVIAAIGAMVLGRRREAPEDLAQGPSAAAILAAEEEADAVEEELLEGAAPEEVT